MIQGCISNTTSSYRVAGITVQDIWTRPASSGMVGHGGDGITSIYMTISNSGPRDQLVGASTPIAKNAMLHQTTIDRGFARMAHVDRIEIPSNGQTALKPGGYHLMLMDLSKDLKPNDVFSLTLQFERAGSVLVQVQVQPAA